MGFWLLVPGVGMGGGTASQVVAGPYCVCETQTYRAGSAVGQFYRAGSEVGEAYRAGSAAGQGECDCA